MGDDADDDNVSNGDDDKPDGNGNFDLVANMLPEEWLKLGGS